MCFNKITQSHVMEEARDRAVFANLAAMYDKHISTQDMVEYLEAQKKTMNHRNYYMAYLSIASSLMVDEQHKAAHEMTRHILSEYTDISEADRLVAIVLMASTSSFYDPKGTLQFLPYRNDIATKVEDCLKLFEFDTAVCRALMHLKRYKEAHPRLNELIRYARDNYGKSAPITLQLTMWMAMLLYNSEKIDKATPFVLYLFKHREKFTAMQQETIDKMHAVITRVSQ